MLRPELRPPSRLALEDAFANLHPCADDSRGIEANFSYRWQPNAVRAEKRPGSAAQSQHLAIGDGFERIPECGVASSLHFTHHQHPIAQCNHIELAAGTPPVAGNDRVALSLVPRGNEILGESSPRLIRSRPTRPSLIRLSTATADNRRLRR